MCRLFSRRTAPDYAVIPGDFAYPQPSLLQGTRFHNFIFQSNYEALQKVCDTWFNIPSREKIIYRPLVDKVILTYANYRSAASEVEPYRSHGFVPYQEIIFAFFVLGLKKRGSRWVAQRINAFVPYIFLDDIIPTIIGREIFGMPKTQAGIVAQTDPDQDFRFAAEVTTLKKFASTTPATSERLISLEQNNRPRATESEVWQDEEETFKKIRQAIFPGDTFPLPSLSLAIELFRFFAKKQLPFVSLKQNRSISDGTKASYQAIVEFPCELQKLHRAGLLSGDYTLHLEENDLFPMRRDLALDADQKGQKAEFAFYLDWDFSFENGRELWRG